MTTGVGLAIDAGDRHKAFIEASELAWRHTVDAKTALLTADTLDRVIGDSGYHGDIGLVSIDVDGIDYWLLAALGVVSPRILVVEYNSLFGPERAVTVPYDPELIERPPIHPRSISACRLRLLTSMARTKVCAGGIEPAGTNAFFVRRDVLGDIPEHKSQTPGESSVRQARDTEGRLLYTSGREAQLRMIADLPLIDVVTGEASEIRQLFAV